MQFSTSFLTTVFLLGSSALAAPATPDTTVRSKGVRNGDFNTRAVGYPQNFQVTSKQDFENFSALLIELEVNVTKRVFKEVKSFFESAPQSSSSAAASASPTGQA
ncbi:hypothetical protein GGR56DRAFT_662023 [Xylariaceae sp. FL0804]|nr:hypothetical protein GGR56DRAFT_662023 [Xylariaceae sp. FL0804]